MKGEVRGGVFGALASIFKEESSYTIRPPYASLGETFEACKTCEGMCVASCEEKIIFRDAHGLAFLDFKHTGCSNCDKCREACTPNVLHDPTRFIQGRAKITTMSCMSHHDVICFACKEPCLEDAIVFQGMFRPIIIPEKCTACGYCLALCPSDAISIVA